MNRAKTAEFLADCLAHMPDQPEEVQAIVNTATSGLNRIASGGKWTEEDSRAYKVAALAADGKESWVTAAAAYASAWVIAWATSWSPSWPPQRIDASRAAGLAAHWAAETHPNPDAERVRQKAKIEELGQ